MKLNSRDIEKAVNDIGTAAGIAALPEEEAERVRRLMKAVLLDYAARFGEDAEFEYQLRKRFISTEIKIIVPGRPFDPILSGNDPEFHDSYKLVSNLIAGRTATVFYLYAHVGNIISIRVPRLSRKKLFNSTTLWATALGILGGLLIRELPASAYDFIVDDLADPLLSVLLRVLSGITGPTVFLSLISCVTTLSGISELNTLGKSIIRRFIAMTMFVSLLSIAVCSLLFPNFGNTAASFMPGQLVDLFLSIIPTNLFSPFVENKLPQLIILGLGMGTALLMVGERGHNLRSLLDEASIWLSSLMSIVGRIAPLITFLNLFTLTAAGELMSIIGAWKYLAGLLLCMLVYMVWKFFFVALRHSIDPLLLLRKLKPIVLRKLLPNLGTAKVNPRQIAEKELGIQTSFSEFWMPMSHAMLNPSRTVTCIVPAFFIARYLGVSMSSSFLLVLFILSVQLSLVSPGVTSSWVIVFEQLGLPKDYVGVFSACRVMTDNFTSAFNSFCFLLEELDAAYSKNAVDESVLRAPASAFSLR